MADEPHFPPPRTAGSPYREQAVAPIVRAASPPRRVVVARPEEPTEPAPEKPRPASVLTASEVVREERTYWQRQRLFVRFPRFIGAVLVGLGGWISWLTVSTMLHGGYYGTRSTIAGPVLLLVGAWSVVFGYPLETTGRPPAWWTAGFVTCAVIGVLIGVSLLAALST